MNHPTTHLDDTALAADCHDRVVNARICLDAATVAYAAYPTVFHRTRLVNAAKAYAGAESDVAFVGDDRRTATKAERH